MRFAALTAAGAVVSVFLSYFAVIHGEGPSVMATWFVLASIIFGIGALINVGAFWTRVTTAALTADDKADYEAKQLTAVRTRMVATDIKGET